MAKRTKYILTILSILIIWGLNGFAQADDTEFKIVDANEIPGVLSMLASAIEGNFDKIKTWQCKIAQETISTNRGEQVAEILKKFTNVDLNNVPNEYQRISKYTIEFKVDVKNNRFFSFIYNAEPYIYLNPKTNVVYSSRLDHWSGPEKELIQIVTPEHQTEIAPSSWRKKDNAITSRMAIKELPHPVHRTDPRKVFYQGERTLWWFLFKISKNLQTPGVEHFNIVLKKKSAGSNITYRMELTMSGKDKPYNMSIFASEAGFNETYFENYYDDGSLMSKETIEFAKVQDVFLPKKWETLQYFQDGGVMRQENCKIESQQINISIPEETFSECKYLHDGDIFRDKVGCKEYKVKDANLVFVADLPAPASGKQNSAAEPNK